MLSKRQKTSAADKSTYDKVDLLIDLHEGGKRMRGLLKLQLRPNCYDSYRYPRIALEQVRSSAVIAPTNRKSS